MAVVLFSGGCDSTFVLYNLLKEHEHDSEYITALSVNHCQVPAINQNKNARELFKKEMNKRELCYKVSFCEIDIKNSCGEVQDITGLSQPIIWAVIAMLYVRNGETIYFGYHSGDDFWQHRNEFEDAIKNACKICGKDITIKYPLQFLSKADIVQSLKLRGLYDLCWYCEYPTVESKPCGNCVPCRTHRTALWQNETFGNTVATTGGMITAVPVPSNFLNGDDPKFKADCIDKVSSYLDMAVKETKADVGELKGS
jgi:7-cyano-7-deazaguanine synthase in queuosine biosynthesis